MNFKENKKILTVLGILIILFMSLIIYLSYFTIFKAQNIINHPANRRDQLEVAAIKRGTIYDRDNNVVAYSDGEKYKYKRHYTYPTIYSHLVGYSSKVRGSTGIEASYNKYLLGTSTGKTIKSIKAFFNKNINIDEGYNLKLTTNSNIQQKSRDLLDELGESGSIVVLNPKTGEIYSMVSYPDFNLQNIDRDYQALVEQNNGVFFNNAIQGGFTPGSTFKIITAAGIIENNIDRNYKDTGEEKIGGYPIRNAEMKVYGNIDLNSAFTSSVNTYFANKSIAIGQEKFKELAERFMFNKNFDFDLNTSVAKLRMSTFNYNNKWDNQSLASAGIGHADISVTPLEMAMVASAIANDGKIMKPYLVSKVSDNAGSDIYAPEPELLSQAVDEKVAEEIKSMMVNVINKGTGKEAALRSVQVAGKTGTAQRSKEMVMNDAWFVGFAPAEDPQVAVAVVIQNVEKLGGEVAAPVARDIISYSLKELSK